jgi:hypothetical protein
MSPNLTVSRKGWTHGGSSASHTNRDKDTNMAMAIWTGGTDERNTVHVATYMSNARNSDLSIKSAPRMPHLGSVR